MSDEHLSAAALAVLDLLAIEPLPKSELARRLSMRPTTLSGHLGILARQGRVVINGGKVGLPGMLDETEAMTAEERLHEQFKMLWQQRGVLAINPIDIEDRFVRERLCLIGIALYGRRGAPR